MIRIESRIPHLDTKKTAENIVDQRRGTKFGQMTTASVFQYRLTI
jgi:hypothetical protein